MVEDYYALLDVDPDATEEEILRAYRTKAAEHHPDVSDDPDAEEAFRALTRARAVLTDPSRRRRYDRQTGDGSHVRPRARSPAPSGAWFGSIAVDLRSVLVGQPTRRAGERWRAGVERDRATDCPRCLGRGTFVHVLDSGGRRHRRLEPCETCRGSGTVPA